MSEGHLPNCCKDLVWLGDNDDSDDDDDYDDGDDEDDGDDDDDNDDDDGDDDDEDDHTRQSAFANLLQTVFSSYIFVPTPRGFQRNIFPNSWNSYRVLAAHQKKKGQKDTQGLKRPTRAALPAELWTFFPSIDVRYVFDFRPIYVPEPNFR